MIDITPIDASLLVNQARWRSDYRTLNEWIAAHAGIYAPAAVRRELLRLAVAGDLQRLALRENQVWHKDGGNYLLNAQLPDLWSSDALARRYWPAFKLPYVNRYKPVDHQTHRHRPYIVCDPSCPKYGLPWTTT